MIVSDFPENSLIWLNTGDDYFVAGTIKTKSNTQINILDEEGNTHTIQTTELKKIAKIREKIPEKGIEDMIKLHQLHEGSIILNLKIRFKHNLIYTYTGSILLATNPYYLFDIYNVETACKYEGRLLGELPPHIFAISNAAFMHMCANKQNQCLIVSGESGAGKTETTKLVMQYLAIINKTSANTITEKILEATPILESFGNSKTIRNDNSSRFGKYTDIFFDIQNCIQGAKISDYLLEKSRIVFHADEERNYHVFYEMLAGLTSEQLKKYNLLMPENYFYLNQGKTAKFNGKSDSQDFKRLIAAIDFIGIKVKEKDGIFQLLASILHLGNVCFRSRDKEDATAFFKNTDAIEKCCTQLRIELERLKKALTHKRTVTRGEEFHTQLTVEQALDTRDALAKTLYSRLFNWIVMKINSIVSSPTSKIRNFSIAVLDIFGFEMFQVNSLEQLCINFANEQLQFYFNQYIFFLEQEEYTREKITWTNIEFRDNQPCIDLISKSPKGILHILDDESHFPKATDESFLEKCHHEHNLNSYYIHPKQKALVFGIRHFAGSVWYNVEYFLDKNRDVLRIDLIDILQNSSLDFVREIFNCETFQALQTISSTTTRKKIPTVSAKFSSSLNALIDTMSKCHPFFVRCIKPNISKAPLYFSDRLVLEQLRYSGMLETIRIRKSGFPVRLTFEDFVNKYHFLTACKDKLLKLDCQSGVLYILNLVSATGYQVGYSKVFLRETTELYLEKKKIAHIQLKCIVIQKTIRCYLAKIDFSRRKVSVHILQNAARCYLARKRYLLMLNSAIFIQSYFRMYITRKNYLKKIIEKRKLYQQKIQKVALMKAEKMALEMSKIKSIKRNITPMKINEELNDTRNRISEFTPQSPFKFGEDILSILDTINKIWIHPHLNKDTRHLTPQEQNQLIHTPQTVRPLPESIEKCPFSKYVTAFFQEGREFALVKNRAKISFLKLPPSLDRVAKHLFPLVQEFLTNRTLSMQDEIVFGNYVINNVLQSSSLELKNELLVQLCNQCRFNFNEDELSKSWTLLSLCISVFPLTKEIDPFFINFASNYAYDGYKAHCQYKSLRTHYYTVPRTYPPCLLEWRAAREFSTITLQIEFPEISKSKIKNPLIAVDSWSRGSEVAKALIKSRVTTQPCEGWSLVLYDEIQRLEIPGHSYVLDSISFLEIPPFFSSPKNSPFLCSWKGKPRNDHTLSRTNTDIESVSLFVDKTFDPIFDDIDNKSLNLSIDSNSGSVNNDDVITAELIPDISQKPLAPIFKYPKIETIPITYVDPNWQIMLRKEYFAPKEDICNPIILDYLFCQIIQDVLANPICIKITNEERKSMIRTFQEYNLSLHNFEASIPIKKSIINAAKRWECYFSQIYSVEGIGSAARFTHIGINHTGVVLIKQMYEGATLDVLESHGFNSIHECSAGSEKSFKLSINQAKELQFLTPYSSSVISLFHEQTAELEENFQFVLAIRDYVTQGKTLLSFTEGSIIKILPQAEIDSEWLYGEYNSEKGAFPREVVIPIIGDEPTTGAVDRAKFQNVKRLSVIQSIHEDELKKRSIVDIMVTQHLPDNEIIDSPKAFETPMLKRRPSKVLSRVSTQNVKWSITEFGAAHFRFGKDRLEFERKFSSSLRLTKQSLPGTIKEKILGTKTRATLDHFSITRLFSYTRTPIKSSLLRLPASDITLNKLAVECFVSIMVFMGDYMKKGQSEEDVFVFILKCGLEFDAIRDEIFCQIVKQTTNNLSYKIDSCTKGWQLLNACCAFFPCSEILQPYLFHHFLVISEDTQSLHHYIAASCLTGIRKSFRTRGRKNLPTQREISILLAGRYSKALLIELPGIQTRIEKIYSHTLVQDIISNICLSFGIDDLDCIEEFQLFIDFGQETQIMPLEFKEYMFDILQAIEKESLKHRIIFKRVVWFHDIKLREPEIVEIIFHQLVAHFMKGYLVMLDEESSKLKLNYQHKIIRMIILLHLAMGNTGPPDKDDIAKIIPKIVLKTASVDQWLKSVREEYFQLSTDKYQPIKAKIDFISESRGLPHFGSAFFKLFSVDDTRVHGECLLAINKYGIHFLHATTHKTMLSYAHQDIVSTRKVRSNEGRQYLDMKCGNLMVQKIIRCETPQSHEIAPIIRQYIKYHMESNLVKQSTIL